MTTTQTQCFNFDGHKVTHFENSDVNFVRYFFAKKVIGGIPQIYGFVELTGLKAQRFLSSWNHKCRCVAYSRREARELHEVGLI